MTHCTRCGAQLNPSDRFCGACAAPVASAPPAAPNNFKHSPDPYASGASALDAAPPADGDWSDDASTAAAAYAAPRGLAASMAAHCDYGHEIPSGSGYCAFGHPISLGEMKFDAGDAFGPTSPPPHELAAHAAFADYSAQNLVPEVVAAYQPQMQPAPIYQPSPAAAPGWQPVADAPSPAPYAPRADQPVAANATAPAEVAGRRILRGFLVSFHGDANGTYWPLYSGHNVIGRAGSGEVLDIQIADPTTSSRHAVISFDEHPGPMVEDVGSTNGTFVNDQATGYRGSAELHDGDRIKLGGYDAMVRFI